MILENVWSKMYYVIQSVAEKEIFFKNAKLRVWPRHYNTLKRAANNLGTVFSKLASGHIIDDSVRFDTTRLHGVSDQT